MATITGAEAALKAIRGLKDKPKEVKDAMNTAAQHAEAAMKVSIEASLPTGWGSPPDDRQRIKTGNMLDSIGIWDTQSDGGSTVHIGIKNAPDYVEAQDLGWGWWGAANKPDGAHMNALKGFYGREAAMAAARAALDKELK